MATHNYKKVIMSKIVIRKRDPAPKWVKRMRNELKGIAERNRKQFRCGVLIFHGRMIGRLGCTRRAVLIDWGGGDHAMRFKCDRHCPDELRPLIAKYALRRKNRKPEKRKARATRRPRA